MNRLDIKFWPIAVTMFCALMGSTGQLLFKLGSGRVGGSLISWLLNPYILGGFVLYGLSAVLFILTLKHGNLSVLYPIIATSYIWVALIASLYLHEPFPPVKWLGVAFICLGIVFIVRS